MGGKNTSSGPPGTVRKPQTLGRNGQPKLGASVRGGNNKLEAQTALRRRETALGAKENGTKGKTVDEERQDEIHGGSSTVPKKEKRTRRRTSAGEKMEKQVMSIVTLQKR